MTRMDNQSDGIFILPTKQLYVKVRIRQISRMDQGAINDLHGGRVEDLISKGMTTMIRDTNNVSNGFNSIRSEMPINLLVVNLLPKWKRRRTLIYGVWPFKCCNGTP